MAGTAKIAVSEGDLLTALRSFLRALLEQGGMDGILVQQQLPMKNVVMPTLVTDPEKLDAADPLAPAFPLNAAKMVSKLTRKPLGAQVAAVLRPCEIRAFIELVKLKQGSLDEVVLVGIDCLGAYGNVDYPRFVAEGANGATQRFYRNIMEGKGTACQDFDLSPACKACEYPIPDNADLLIGLVGVDLKAELWVKANTEKGQNVLDTLSLPEAPEPEGRHAAIADLIKTARRLPGFHVCGDQ